MVDHRAELAAGATREADGVDAETAACLDAAEYVRRVPLVENAIATSPGLPSA
jgi:hypothetical protein